LPSFFAFSLAVLGLHFSFVSLPLFSRMTREGKRERERERRGSRRESTGKEQVRQLKMRRDNAFLSRHPSTLYALSPSLSLSLSSHSLPLRRRGRSFAFAKNGAKEQARKPRHRYRLPPSLHVCAIKNCCVVFLHVCRRGSERGGQGRAARRPTAKTCGGRAATRILLLLCLSRFESDHFKGDLDHGPVHAVYILLIDVQLRTEAHDLEEMQFGCAWTGPGKMLQERPQGPARGNHVVTVL
jgi:hypothetical protein